MRRRAPSRARRAAFGAALCLGAGLAAAACAREARRAPAGDEETWAAARSELVERRVAREVHDERVLEALRRVPRHLFVPPALRDLAYEDRPLPIGEGQTISQPTIVGIMTELLDVGPGSKVLEVGTGSGYQAAVLAELGAEVYSIEILPGIARQGAANLAAAGYERVHLRVGDGYLGWPEAAPFDGVLVTCAPERIPPPLQEQLAEGGRLVIPVGKRGGVQELVLVEKREGELRSRRVIPVRFVPMTGRAQQETSRKRGARAGP